MFSNFHEWDRQTKVESEELRQLEAVEKDEVFKGATTASKIVNTNQFPRRMQCFTCYKYEL